MTASDKEKGMPKPTLAELFDKQRTVAYLKSQANYDKSVKEITRLFRRQTVALESGAGSLYRIASVQRWYQGQVDRILAADRALKRTRWHHRKVSKRQP